MRIVRGKAEHLVDPRLDLVGEVVLETLRLGVHGVPAQPERLRQYASSNRWWRTISSADALARGCEARAVVRLVFDEAEARELLQHPRHGRGGHGELRGEGGRRDPLFRAMRQIVLR